MVKIFISLIFCLFGCSTVRSTAGGLSVASGIVMLGGGTYMTATADSHTAPYYVVGAAASAILSATFFTLGAYLLSGESVVAQSSENNESRLPLQVPGSHSPTISATQNSTITRITPTNNTIRRPWWFEQATRTSIQHCNVNNDCPYNTPTCDTHICH